MCQVLLVNMTVDSIYGLYAQLITNRFLLLKCLHQIDLDVSSGKLSLSMLRDLLPLHQITNLPRSMRGGGITVITHAGLRYIKNEGNTYITAKFSYVNSQSVGNVGFILVSKNHL